MQMIGRQQQLAVLIYRSGFTKDLRFMAASTNSSNARDKQSSTSLLQQKLHSVRQRLLFAFSKNNSMFTATTAAAPQVIQAAEQITGNEGFWKRIFNYLEELSHMDEVRVAQERVLTIKNGLREAGDEKRAILKELDQVRNDLNNIYKEMKFIGERSSGQYLQLVKMEIDLCPREKELQDAFTKADEREQQLFNAFSAAISDSYEKEKVHSNFLKVLGVVGTIVGSFLTLIISIVGQINHQNKFYSLRQDFENTLSTHVARKIDELNQRLEPLEQAQQAVVRVVTSAQGQLRQNPESWGSYLKRHTRWVYGWAMPKH